MVPPNSYFQHRIGDACDSIGRCSSKNVSSADSGRVTIGKSALIVAAPRKSLASARID
jgi:hypothetical protein